MRMGSLFASFLVSFGLLVIAMSVHEFAHGWVADRLGDNTARYSGRLTLNPLAHIDPFWTFLLPLFLFMTSAGQFVFGAARPVPINYQSLKNPRKDIVWIGASGPLANFLFGIILIAILKFTRLPINAVFILGDLVVINVVLGVFNLIPIPPLDGSRILMGLLPSRLSAKYMLLEPYGFLIVMFLLWLGVFGRIIGLLIDLLAGLMRVIF